MTRVEREALLAMLKWRRSVATGSGRVAAEYRLGLAAVALEDERHQARVAARRARRAARAAPRPERPRLLLTEVDDDSGGFRF